MAVRGEDKRKFPRSAERIPVELSLSSGKREFKARVYTADISLTGVFFASEFFLKAGTELDLELRMPGDERLIRIRGVIVREVRVDDRRPGQKKVLSGFGMRFVDYKDDAKTVLASAFLAHRLHGFVEDYLRRRTQKLKTETEQLRDVLVAWEVSRMDMGLAEREFILGAP